MPNHVHLLIETTQLVEFQRKLGRDLSVASRLAKNSDRGDRQRLKELSMPNPKSIYASLTPIAFRIPTHLNFVQGQPCPFETQDASGMIPLDNEGDARDSLPYS